MIAMIGCCLGISPHAHSPEEVFLSCIISGEIEYFDCIGHWPNVVVVFFFVM